MPVKCFCIIWRTPTHTFALDSAKWYPSSLFLNWILSARQILKLAAYQVQQEQQVAGCFCCASCLMLEPRLWRDDEPARRCTDDGHRYAWSSNWSEPSFSHSFSFFGVKSYLWPSMTEFKPPGFIAFVKQSAGILAVDTQCKKLVAFSGR